MKTAYEDENWETQLRTMMSEEDAQDVARTFNKIINAHIASQDDPFTVLEIGLGQDEVAHWLEVAHQHCLTVSPADPTYGIMWMIGMECSRTYLDRKEMPPDDVLSAAASFFFATGDDNDDDDGDDDDGDPA